MLLILSESIFPESHITCSAGTPDLLGSALDESQSRPRQDNVGEIAKSMRGEKPNGGVGNRLAISVRKEFKWIVSFQRQSTRFKFNRPGLLVKNLQPSFGI
jgi:hypothetical protein